MAVSGVWMPVVTAISVLTTDEQRLSVLSLVGQGCRRHEPEVLYIDVGSEKTVEYHHSFRAAGSQTVCEIDYAGIVLAYLYGHRDAQLRHDGAYHADISLLYGSGRGPGVYCRIVKVDLQGISACSLDLAGILDPFSGAVAVDAGDDRYSHGLFEGLYLLGVLGYGIAADIGVEIVVHLRIGVSGRGHELHLAADLLLEERLHHHGTCSGTLHFLYFVHISGQ